MKTYRRIIFGYLLFCCGLFPVLVQAEGSRSLYPSTYSASGSRAALDFSTPAQYYVGKVHRYPFIYVYAQAGEYILVGSSNRTANAVGVINIYPPQDFGIPGNETTPPAVSAVSTCTTGTNGRISTRAMELLGPKSVDGTGNTSGYVPCAYAAATTGIYGIIFGLASSNVGTMTDIATTASSTTHVPAWDVTVRSSSTSSITDLNGRLFTYAFIAMSGGGKVIYTTHYYVTSDGYRYSEDMRGFDPNGYAIYANSLGFLDNSEPLYKDLRGNDAVVSGTPVGVTTQIPQYPLFFSDVTPGTNPEVNQTLTALGIPTTSAASVPVVADVSFVGNVPVTLHSTVGAGGTFTFSTTNTITYQIIISKDGSDFDPGNTANATLKGIAATGTHSVAWDGRDGTGTNFPAGTYPYKVYGRAGEVHFPIIDTEGNAGGGPTITLLDGITNTNHTAYFDDRGYITNSGSLVGTLNNYLCGAASPTGPNPQYGLGDATGPVGINSTTAYRFWPASGNSNTVCNAGAGWGDAKGLNLWTYYNSLASPTANLVIDAVTFDAATAVSAPKVVTTSGSTVQGAFRFNNNGTGTILGVTYSVDIGTACNAPTVAFGNLPALSVASCALVSGKGHYTFTNMPGSLGNGAVVLGTIAAAPITFSYTALASGSYTVTTHIATSGTTDDPFPGTSNNDASVTTYFGTTNVEALVSVPATIDANGTVDGNFGFANYSGGVASAWTHTVTIGSAAYYPPSVTFTSLPTGIGASYNNTNGAVTFTGLPTNLAAGQSFGFRFTYPAPLSGTVPVTLTTNATGDANPNDNTDTGNTTVIIPDVYTSINAPGNVAAGGLVSTQFTFGNQGAKAAAGVTYAATLPTGLTDVACSGASCSYNSGSGALAITGGLPTSLNPGQANQVLVTYTAPASGPLAVNSTITTTTAYESPGGNNTAIGSTTVGGASVVDVAAWLNAPASVTTGSSVNIAVSFTNVGGLQATGVTYGMTLNSGLTGVVSCTSSDGLSCVYNNITGVITVTGPTPLNPGQQVALTLIYTAPSAVASPVNVSATVSATSDANAGNNTANGSTIINATSSPPDVMSTVAPPASAIPNSIVTVPLTYKNVASDPATVTSYKVTLSAGSGASVTYGGNGCTYDSGTGAIAGCSLPGTLNPGQTLNLVLTYTAPAISSTVIITSDITATNDAYAPNNSSTSNTSITNPAGITVSTISGNTTEAGGTATFTVVLDSQPTADVTIGLTSDNTAEGTVSPTSLTFTSGNWSTTQTVTVTGVDDFVVDGNIGYSIVTAAATGSGSGYVGINAADVAVTNTDNDVAGITVNPTSGLTTTEAGGAATFTVKLTSQPTADVTIGLTSSNITEGTVSPTSLTFTSGNWSTNQTVTVTGVNDFVVDGNIGYSITTAAASSADANYNGLNAADVSVTNNDNDVAGITVTPTSGLTTTEAGGTATFTVKLTSQPTADVTIGLSSDNTAEGTVFPTSLTFTSGNWSTTQTVTIAGVDDFVVDGNIGYSIVTAAATGSGSGYVGINAADVAVTNMDNDVAGITVTPISGLTTTEAGGTATFTVVLDSQPAADVTIGLTSDDITEGTLSDTSLTFTSANWNNAQTVTITGVDDGIIDVGTSYSIVTAAATGSGSGYDGINAANVAVTNIDDDILPAPGGVAGYLQLWLKADAEVKKAGSPAIDLDLIDTWRSQSFNGFIASNGGLDGQTAPLFHNSAAYNLNFNPVVEFNGLTTGLDLGTNYIYAPAINLGLALFAVVQPVSTQTTAEPVLDFGDAYANGYGLLYGTKAVSLYTPTGAGGKVSGGAVELPAETGPVVVTGKVTFGGTQQVYLNGNIPPPVYESSITGLTQLTGSEINESALHSTSTGPVTIGRESHSSVGNGHLFAGKIPEVIVYNAALTDTNRSKVQSYLALKYGITLETDYLASDGTTIWTIGGGYDFDIAGIGKDTNSSLNQPKSKSSNSGALITMEATAPLADKTFLIWGDNGGPTTYSRVGAPADKLYQILGKTWQVANTGSVGTVTLSTSDTTNARILLVDTDGNFTTSATEYPITAGSVAGVPLTHGQYFTFARPIPSQTAVTGSYSLVSTNSVVITGEVNGNGVDVTVQFDYGLTTSYGSTKDATPTLVTAAMGNTFVQKGLTGLTCGTQYHYRVKAYDDIRGLVEGSDKTFTTSACPLPTVTAPINGAIWTVGLNYTIGWSWFPGTKVQIDLYNGGGLNRTIASQAVNSGSFIWNVPSTQSGGTNYSVRVTPISEPSQYRSSGTFTINAPAPKPIVTYPTSSGIIWSRGSNGSISWTGFPGTRVAIYLYKGGSLNRTIASQAVNTGSFTWNVLSTQVVGTDYKIRVTASTGQYDESDNLFKIK